MNDINWRDLDDDESWELLVKYPDNLILVETNITFRIDNARNLEDRPAGPYLETAQEKAIRFAFVK